MLIRLLAHVLYNTATGETIVHDPGGPGGPTLYLSGRPLHGEDARIAWDVLCRHAVPRPDAEPDGGADRADIDGPREGERSPPVDPEAPRRFRYRRGNLGAGHGVYWPRSDRYTLEHGGSGIGPPGVRRLPDFRWLDPGPMPRDTEPDGAADRVDIAGARACPACGGTDLEQEPGKLGLGDTFTCRACGIPWRPDELVAAHANRGGPLS